MADDKKLANMHDLLPKFKEKLDNISPSFCAAKWQQVTIHLATGHTHSCHHPTTHKIPVEELVGNPSALHNTNYKKEQRKLMLEGVRPSECDYCWRVEDANTEGSTVFSDRITKSFTPWSQPYIESISKRPWDDNVNPANIEISFSNVCNFKCAYCSPEVSSKWMEEINQYGPYSDLIGHSFNNIEWLRQTDKFPIPERDDNPYVDAFWKWFPEAIKQLKIFRITGGEPLLSKHTFGVLDYIIDNPQPDLELNINSNLCVPKALFNKFVKKVQYLMENKLIKDFKMYTSVDAYGGQAEYIRHGLDYKIWFENCETILRDIPNSYLTFMCTYNALSVVTFDSMLRDVLYFKRKYTVQPHRSHPVSIDVPYLRYPDFLSIFILTPDFLDYVEKSVTFMYTNKQHTHWPPLCGNGFFDYEINRMERVYWILKNHLSGNEVDSGKVKLDRINFYKYITEHDRRRETDFLKVFPEYSDFFLTCKKESENYNV